MGNIAKPFGDTNVIENVFCLGNELRRIIVGFISDAEISYLFCRFSILKGRINPDYLFAGEDAIWRIWCDNHSVSYYKFPIKYCHYSTIERFREMRIPFDIFNRSKTVLWEVARHYDLSVCSTNRITSLFRAQLDHGDSPDIDTCIEAANCGDMDHQSIARKFTESLISKGNVDVHDPNINGSGMPLFQYFSAGAHRNYCKPEVFQTFLDLGVRVDEVSPGTPPALYHCAMNVNLHTAAQLLIDEGRADITSALEWLKEGKDQKSIRAAEFLGLCKIQQLVNAGVNLDEPTDFYSKLSVEESGLTGIPLVDAVDLGHIEVVKALIEQGACMYKFVNVSGWDYEQPIFWNILESGNETMIQAFIDEGFDLDHVYKDLVGNIRLIECLVLDGKFKLASDMIRRGASIGLVYQQDWLAHLEEKSEQSRNDIKAFLAKYGIEIP